MNDAAAGGTRPLAVITGGTRGIGRAVADRLASQGWEILTLARHPVPGHPHPFAVCDVADPASVRSILDTVPSVSALVNAAGLAGANRLEGDDDLWHAIINSNLHGTYYVCKSVLPKLPDATGRIVNIASVLGLRGVPDQTAYCAAKHGVVGFTRALALALAPRGITVNAICPGWVDTAMAAQRYAELGITAEQAAAGVPTGRVTTPAEVAAAVEWLLRPGSGSITGHALPMEGGGLALP